MGLIPTFLTSNFDTLKFVIELYFDIQRSVKFAEFTNRKHKWTSYEEAVKMKTVESALQARQGDTSEYKNSATNACNFACHNCQGWIQDLSLEGVEC